MFVRGFSDFWGAEYFLWVWVGLCVPEFGGIVSLARLWGATVKIHGSLLLQPYTLFWKGRHCLWTQHILEVHIIIPDPIAVPCGPMGQRSPMGLWALIIAPCGHGANGPMRARRADGLNLCTSGKCGKREKQPYKNTNLQGQCTTHAETVANPCRGIGFALNYLTFYTVLSHCRVTLLGFEEQREL